MSIFKSLCLKCRKTNACSCGCDDYQIILHHKLRPPKYNANKKEWKEFLNRFAIYRVVPYQIWNEFVDLVNDIGLEIPKDWIDELYTIQYDKIRNRYVLKKLNLELLKPLENIDFNKLNRDETIFYYKNNLSRINKILIKHYESIDNMDISYILNNFFNEIHGMDELFKYKMDIELIRSIFDHICSKYDTDIFLTKILSKIDSNNLNSILNDNYIYKKYIKDNIDVLCNVDYRSNEYINILLKNIYKKVDNIYILSILSTYSNRIDKIDRDMINILSNINSIKMSDKEKFEFTKICKTILNRYKKISDRSYDISL